jgi:tetratricopeptide (TPR) repeat protein
MQIFRIFFLSMLVFIWMPGLYGQELAGESDEAENAFSHLEYAKAATYYERIPERDQSIHVMENLATCYYKIKDYSKAVYALKRVLLLYPSDDQIRFKYADAIQHMGNYEFALSQYQFINPGVRDLDGLVKERIQSCKEALRIKSKINLYKVQARNFQLR